MASGELVIDRHAVDMLVGLEGCVTNRHGAVLVCDRNRNRALLGVPPWVLACGHVVLGEGCRRPASRRSVMVQAPKESWGRASMALTVTASSFVRASELSVRTCLSRWIG